jgi:hypothetical protein
VNRDEFVKALHAQPFETDVQVNVGGFLIDITGVAFDTRRHAIVLELLTEDAEQAMSHFVRIGPLDVGTGNSR